MSSKYSTEVIRIAELLSPAAVIEGTTATLPEDSEVRALPEGLDHETANKYRDHQSNVRAAGALIAKDKALDMLVANEEANRVRIIVPMLGGDQATYTVDRTREYGNPQDPKGPKLVKHGQMTFSMSIADSTSSGDLGRAAKELSAAAKERFLKA